MHRRHLRWSADGTWDRVLAAVQAAADAAGELDWRVSVDSTIVRVHQHAATAAVCGALDDRGEVGLAAVVAHRGRAWNDKDRRPAAGRTG